MKANLIILFVVLATVACRPSKKEVVVPENIKAAFSKIHPSATDIYWIQEPSIFEAKFTDGNMKGAVSFNEHGEVVETEEVIKQDQLPNLTGIVDYIKTNYSGESIQRCEKIVKKDSTIIYEIQITGKELVFDSQGNFKEEELD
jgi:hypothetical protein